MSEGPAYSPTRASTVAAIVFFRVLDLVAIGLGGRVLSGRSCPWGCLQEGISNWDAHWYSGIAAFGYSYIPGTDSNAAFFPAFPLLMRWGAPLFGGNYLWSGLAVSLLASVAALVFLVRLVRADFGTPAARRSAILLSAAPTAFFFALPYADALLLMLCVISIFAARRRRWLSATLLAGLAGTVRVTGALLVIPLLWEFCEQNSWRVREVFTARSLRRLLLLAIAPLGIVAYMIWLQIRFSEPLAFFKAQLDGWPHRTTWLLRPVWDTGVELTRPGKHLGGLRPDLYWSYALDIAVLVAAAVLFVTAMRRRMPGVYLLWWGVALIFPLMSGTTHSFARYTLVAFPLYVAAALVLRRRAAFLGVASASLVLQLVLARAHGMGWWVG
ncbi:MAG: hypothetical protein DCC49_05890 [Acidobacteria bacterium]|nr:MAG: hypothetical protein DCC49_05890 [Acidobacteriota bacterium]